MYRGKKNGKIHIVTKHPHSKETPHYFYSEQGIGESGIYRIHHDQHGLPSEVTLRAGQTFPTCSKCSEPVRFELVRSISSADDTGFFVNLYSLPASDAPATHSDSIHLVPNPQQQREHDAADAFVKGQNDRNRTAAAGEDEDEPAA